MRIRQMTIGHRPRRGFTLAEVLVVLSIIILVVALMMPAMNQILVGNRDAEALNAIAGILTAARACAIGEGRDAAVRFYMDGQVMVARIYSYSPTLPPSGGFPLDTCVENVPGVTLPAGMRAVGTEDISSGGLGNDDYNEDTDLADQSAFSVCFGPTGELEAASIDDENSEEAIYVVEWDVFSGWNEAERFSGFLNARTDLLVINRYTGELIEPF